MSEITDLGSPDRELSARDIERKENKLRKTKQKLTKNLSGRRRHNLDFKLEKTLDQIDTGLSGIRPIKTPFKLKHQKEYSPLNELTTKEKVRMMENIQSLKHKKEVVKCRYNQTLKAGRCVDIPKTQAPKRVN